MDAIIIAPIVPFLSPVEEAGTGRIASMVEQAREVASKGGKGNRFDRA